MKKLTTSILIAMSMMGSFDTPLIQNQSSKFPESDIPQPRTTNNKSREIERRRKRLEKKK